MLWLTSGTVSVTSGGSTVTGVGTSFTSALVGSEIMLRAGPGNAGAFSGPYLITAIADNTHLTIYPAALQTYAAVGYALRPVSFSMEKDFSDRIDELLSRFDAVLAIAGNDRIVTLNKSGTGNLAEVVFQTAGGNKFRMGLLGNDTFAIQQWNGTTWVAAGDGSGNVAGPAVAVDNGFARFDGTTGKLLKDGGTAIVPGDLDASTTAKRTAFMAALGVREVLSASRQYFVRSDGNDGNDGLANTSARAFLTIQKAVDTAASLDSSIYDVTIFTNRGSTTTIQLKRLLGSGTLNIIGDEVTQSNCLVNPAGTAFWGTSSAKGGNFLIAGFKIQSGGGQDIYAGPQVYIIARNNEYAGTANFRMYCQGGQIDAAGTNNRISGGGISFFQCDSSGLINFSNSTFTLTASVTFTQSFAAARWLGLVISTSVTVNLGGFTVSGPRYNVLANAVMATSGGTNHFPGTSAGSASSGGQYS
jgi:hypothetical protein